MQQWHTVKMQKLLIVQTKVCNSKNIFRFYYSDLWTYYFSIQDEDYINICITIFLCEQYLLSWKQFLLWSDNLLIIFWINHFTVLFTEINGKDQWQFPRWSPKPKVIQWTTTLIKNKSAKSSFLRNTDLLLIIFFPWKPVKQLLQ